MRILVKGGIWRNTEDAVLIAAIQKYGKNQWARVASLLNRKSPKQCKARWYEWLDPSIKKTEWTRDEEEKLLHLAKLYPCQWRTIAPLVGRTAAQCMERYEKLLDDAQRELAGEGAPGATSEEARRLRPGEIDPNPETRPARPDPVDMDEDEKEMLSEARARLANTRGKKAKRKAREAQLDEARRLGSLQKRRELKAAGIYAPRWERKKNKGGSTVDYGSEIPFRKTAPAGFYDPSEEKAADSARKREREDADFEAIRLDRMEAERRDAAERKAQFEDKRKRAKLMDANLPAAVAQVARLNDPVLKLRRSTLSLPAPQVADEELEQLAKMGDLAGAVQTGNVVTDDLVADDAAAPRSLERLLAESRSARTPALAKKDNSLLQEATNAVVDRSLQTPLLGENQTERLAGTGFDSVKPTTERRHTPGILATTLGDGSMSKKNGRGQTPSSSSLAARLRLPSTQEEDEDDGSKSAVSFSSVKSSSAVLGLKSLPAPKYAYEIEAPPRLAPIAEDEEPSLRQVVDASERDAAEQAAAESDRLARLARRSSAVKKSLPLPKSTSDTHFLPLADSAASRLICDEATNLLRRDTADTESSVDPDFDDEELSRARSLVEAEVVDPEAELPTSQWRFEDVPRMPSAALVSRLKAAFDVNRAQMAKGASRAARIEDRVEPKLAPLVDKAALLRDDVTNAAERLDKASVQVACFERLHKIEKISLPKRLAQAKETAKLAAQREADLQRQYSALKLKLDNIRRADTPSSI